MIRQIDAQNMCDTELRKYGLWDKGWRTAFTKVEEKIAICAHDYKRIVFSIPHLNARSEVDLQDTIKHELAHALVGPGFGHGPVWVSKALELGLKNPQPCGVSNVDGGRAISPVEIKEAPKIKAIQNSCPVCFKVAVEKSSCIIAKVKWSKLECGHLVKHDQIKSIEQDIMNWTSNMGKKVFPYQVDGIKFVGQANGRALIADEPGLGKTNQALGAIFFYPEMRPALWVCKPNLRIQALKEAIDWCGPTMMGQVIEHKKMFIIPNLNLYIVSMDLLRNIPTEKLEEIPFKTVIVDEVQHFKNPDSTRTAELRKLVARAEYFLALSGTPWKNRASEYFPVLNMLAPQIFPSWKHFKNNWVDTYFDKDSGKFREGGILNIEKFKEVTKPFIIRRLRDDVQKDLPPIDRRIRFVDMDELYAKSYDKAEGRVAAQIKAAMIDGVPMKNIASIIMQLKHITGVAKVSTAIDDAKEWLENVPDDFEKLTIFHHHIDVGELLQKGDPAGAYEGLDKWLVEHGYNPTLRLFGGVGEDNREYIKESFKNNVKNRILIASTLASGEGLNLQFCQNAYMMERQWNPQNEEQAEFRFSRPLSKGDLPEYLWHLLDRKVSIRIPYYIAAGTIDEWLTRFVEAKRINFKKSMNDKDRNITWDENEIIRELANEIIRKRYKKSA